MSSAPPRAAPGPPGAAAIPDARKSPGLEALVAFLDSGPGRYVLDFGGPIQENIDFITDLVVGAGHRLYVDNLLQSYEHFFSAKEREEEMFRAGGIREFVESTFDFPDQCVDAVLIWDRLQFLPPEVAGAVVAALLRIMAPDAFLLAMFRADPGGAGRAPYQCRILDGHTLRMRELPPVRRVQTFNPRTIEKLFQGFGGVKFFVSRESLQEVLVRR